MTYEIVTKYIKDLSFKINDAKSYFLLEKDIKNYSFVCDIKSKKLKEKIVQADINLRLIPVNKSSNRNLDVKVELTSIIQFDKIDNKDEMEKISETINSVEKMNIEVQNSISNLTKIGEDNSVAAEEISASMIELSSIANNTKNKVSEFKIETDDIDNESNKSE